MLEVANGLDPDWPNIKIAGLDPGWIIIDHSPLELEPAEKLISFMRRDDYQRLIDFGFEQILRREIPVRCYVCGNRDLASHWPAQCSGDLACGATMVPQFIIERPDQRRFAEIRS